MNTEQQNELETAQEISQEEPKQSSTYPAIIDLAAIFGVFVVGQLVVTLLSMLLFGLFAKDLPSEMITAYTLLIAQVSSMLLVILFIAILRRKRGAESTKLSLGVKGFDPVILLSGVVMLLSTTVVLEPLLALMPPPPSLGALGWPLLLSVVVCAPIFEEIICRGMIFESMRKRSGLIAAWLGSSLFFGLLHMHPTMMVNAFFMGLILCYFYIRSGSLLSPIILHAVNNGLAYLCLLMGFSESAMLRDFITNPTIYWIVYSVAAVILIGSSLLCARQFKRIAQQNEEVEENIIDKEKDSLQ